MFEKLSESLVSLLDNATIGFGTFLCARLVDSVTTYYAIAQGAVERMPLANNLMVNFGVIDGLLVHNAVVVAAQPLLAGVTNFAHNRYLAERGRLAENLNFGNMTCYYLAALVSYAAAFHNLQYC